MDIYEREMINLEEKKKAIKNFMGAKAHFKSPID
jgi:hypothetical protein